MKRNPIDECAQFIGWLFVARIPRRVAVHHMTHGPSVFTLTERTAMITWIQEFLPENLDSTVVYRDMEGNII